MGISGRRSRLLALMLAMVAMLAMSSVALAAPGDNSAAAQACEEGGYLNYTRTDGTPFRNAGQCTSYAARGGELQPIPTASISLNQAAGTISGEGFTPNSSITMTRAYSPTGFVFSGSLATDANGAFVDSGYNFCFVSSNEAVTVTVTDGEGVTVTETFALTCS